MGTFRRKLVWLAGVALAPAMFAQAHWEREEPILRGLTDYHHTEWGGLGAIFDIKQSPEGYLWLTTSKGVLRFDGVQFQSLEDVTRRAVDDREIDSVFLSASGGLWLTTEGAGLLLWKDGKLSTFPDRRCTPSRKQGQIVEDRDGALWVQAVAGLFRLRGSVCEQIGPDQGYPGGGPVAIFLDREGTLWAKAQTGPLYSWRRGESRFQKTQYAEGASTGFAFLHEAPDGTIWLSITCTPLRNSDIAFHGNRSIVCFPGTRGVRLFEPISHNCLTPAHGVLFIEWAVEIERILREEFSDLRRLKFFEMFRQWGLNDFENSRTEFGTGRACGRLGRVKRKANRMRNVARRKPTHRLRNI